MTAKQKLGALEHAINQAEMGLTKIVHCPYCGTDLDFSPPAMVKLASDEVLVDDPANHWQPPTCCETFALAAIAILKRKEQTELKDLASRIRRNAGGSPVFN